MSNWKHALPGVLCAGLVVASAACQSRSSTTQPQPTQSQEDEVRAVRTVISSPAPSPTATELPVLPSLSFYTVQSGDNPSLIAEYAGVPGNQRDAWIHELLSLNRVDAYSLRVGQQLILPPLGDGTTPEVDAAAIERPISADPPAAVVEPARPIPEASAAAPIATSASGVPMAPTPPFVGFAQPTPTPTPTPSPSPTPSPTATPTIAPGERAWLTSSDESASYYYCDLDAGWKDIPAEKLLAFDSEQQLLAIWGRFRVKAPDSVC